MRRHLMRRTASTPRPGRRRARAALAVLVAACARPACALQLAGAVRPRAPALRGSEDGVDVEDLEGLADLFDDVPSAQVSIQFVEGVDEGVVPTIKLTRSATSSRDGEFFTGTATFWFENAEALYRDLTVESLITGMRLCDEEGVVATTDVKAKFHRGNPSGITAVLVLSNPTEWDRFMRFMARFAAQSGLAFTAADADAA